MVFMSQCSTVVIVIQCSTVAHEEKLRAKRESAGKPSAKRKGSLAAPSQCVPSLLGVGLPRSDLDVVPLHDDRAVLVLRLAG